MLEIIGSVILLLSVIFLAKRKIIGWYLSIIGAIIYSIIFFNTKLYGNFLLQFIFLYQSIYGIYDWLKYKKDNNKILKETKIDNLNNKKRLIYSISIIIIWIISSILLNNYTNSNLPYIDSLVSIISIFANWLLSIRKIENWILWIFADIIFIGLFFYTGLYITGFLYILFFFNAIYGFYNWKKELSLQKK